MNKLFSNVFRATKKNAPNIITGVGIALMFASIGEAIHVTPKAIDILHEYKNETGEELTTPKEIIKKTWKIYIPTMILASLGTTCIILSNAIQTKRNALLATAYTVSEVALREYTSKVVDILGEKNDQKVRDVLAEEKVKLSPAQVSNDVGTFNKDGESTLCLDSFSGRYFWSTPELIKKAMNDINHEITTEMYASLNDFYYELNLKGIPIGNEVGWNNSKGLLDICFSSTLTEDMKPCLVIDYRNHPFIDFDRLI